MRGLAWKRFGPTEVEDALRFCSAGCRFDICVCFVFWVLKLDAGQLRRSLTAGWQAAEHSSQSKLSDSGVCVCVCVCVRTCECSCA